MVKESARTILVSRREAASMLGISNRTMTNLISAGELEPVCIGSRRLLKREDLLKFVESSHHTTSPQRRNRKAAKRI